MINTRKITQKIFRPQIAGLFPGDNNIEFVGNRKSKKTFWIQNGIIHFFTDLPFEYYKLIKEQYLNDEKAVTFISKIHENLKDQVELYTYYMYGDLDSVPDICNGQLSAAENFRDQRNCPSLLWNNKFINIDDYILSPRDLVMIDMMSDDYKDAVIAEKIGVSHSHYDTLKRNLFHNTGTYSKPGLLLKAKESKVI